MSLCEDLILTTLDRERAKLMAYISAIVVDRHLAEDVYQDVSLLAVSSAPMIADEVHLMHWLRKAARHKALTAVAAARRRPLMIDQRVLDALDDQWQRRDAMSCADLSERLADCLGMLAPAARGLIRLRYEEGLSGEAIARRLGRSVAAVYKASGRIHRELLKCLQRIGGDRAPGGSK